MVWHFHSIQQTSDVWVSPNIDTVHLSDTSSYFRPLGNTYVFEYDVVLTYWRRLTYISKSKSKQQVCISPERARAHLKTNTGVESNSCLFQAGCQFSSVALTPPLEPSFGDSLCGVWNKHAEEPAAGDDAPVWTLWVKSPHWARQYLGSFVAYIAFPKYQNQHNKYI